MSSEELRSQKMGFFLVFEDMKFIVLSNVDMEIDDVEHLTMCISSMRRRFLETGKHTFLATNRRLCTQFFDIALVLVIL